MKTLLIYGGAFDPPHDGHIKTALAVQRDLHFDRFVFLPCKTPVLKNATLATSKQRIHMLQLALQPYPEFEIDPREITRSTPSFMVETLKSFREALGYKVAITICLGTDAFIQLPQWHCWQKILELSNILVIRREQINEQELPEIKKLVLTHETFDKKALKTQAFGKIYQFDAGQFPISSSWLRSQMQAGYNIEEYLPANVYQYIKDQALYPLYPTS